MSCLVVTTNAVSSSRIFMGLDTHVTSFPFSARRCVSCPPHNLILNQKWLSVNRETRIIFDIFRSRRVLNVSDSDCSPLLLSPFAGQSGVNGESGHSLSY